MMPNPCCCGKCVVFKDDFSHPFERINGNDSTGNWIGLPNLSTEPGPPESCWEWGGIGFYLLCGNHFSSTTPQFIWRGTAPRHVSATLGIVPANIEQEFSLTYGADDGTNVKRYRVKITISDESRYSLDEHYTATPTHCGKISLWDATDVTALVPLSINVPVPGLCALTGSGTSPPPGVQHLLTLCYDPETQVLSAHVAVYLGGVYALHALNCATPADPLIGSGLSFEVDNFNGADQGAVFTSFTVKQTKNLPDGYGYGYGYDGTDDQDCPCCGPRGCQDSSIDVAADPLDCRLHVSSGSISQASDGDGAYLRLANNTKIQWLSSWSGLDKDCLPDRTFYLTFALRINAFAMFANVELAWLDSAHRIWASIFSETGAGANNGTLSIFQSDGTRIDIATLTGDIKGQWVTVTVCYDGFTLTASALGQIVEGEADDPGGQFIGFKSNNAGFFDTFDIKDVTVSHDIYKDGCRNCGAFDLGSGVGWSGGGSRIVSCNDFLCELGKVPDPIKLTIRESVCATFPGPIVYNLNATNLIGFDDELCSGVEFGRCDPVHSVVSLDQAVVYSGVLHGPNVILNGGVPYIGGTVDFPCGPEPSCEVAADGDGKRRYAVAYTVQIYLGKKDTENKVIVVITATNTEEAFCLGEAYAVYSASLGNDATIDCLAVFDEIELNYVESFVCCDTGRVVGADEFCKWSSLKLILSR